MKNLTRDDPLYASWTSHLETPLEITLNNSVSLNTINRSGNDRPGTNTPGNLKQDQLDTARGTAHQQINTLSQRMGLFKAYVSNSSSLTDEDKALLITETENSTLWLSGKDAEIQSATNVGAARQSMADVETLMPMLEADLQRNAGLLACNEINGRIGEALNVSINLSDRIGQMGLSDKDMVLAHEYLADCREHLLNASLYSDRAAETFQGIDGSENSESRYLEGLSLIQQSRDELNMAYMTINKLFHLTVEHTNTNKS